MTTHNIRPGATVATEHGTGTILDADPINGYPLVRLPSGSLVRATVTVPL